jgi:hypothetical protein
MKKVSIPFGASITTSANGLLDSDLDFLDVCADACDETKLAPSSKESSLRKERSTFEQPVVDHVHVAQRICTGQ